MLTDLPILTVITFIPLIGSLLILLHASFSRTEKDKRDFQNNVRWAALWTSLFTLMLVVLMVIGFDPKQEGVQFVENYPWLGSGIAYRFGVDGISVLFILLTAILIPLCILASWQSIQKQLTEYMIAFLVLETFLIGFFCSLDLVLFYIFFEAVLIPMFIIIGVWGGKRRVYASFKFFLYTLLGSLLMLGAMIWMYSYSALVLGAPTTEIAKLSGLDIPFKAQLWLWIAFFAAFSVKLPMWPVHTWLPDAHVEAPTAGSVILAGIMLKMGGYGLIRISIPFFPDASAYFTPLVYTLSVIAIIYTSLIAFQQKDIKKLIAYSSIAHMGFVTLGIFSANLQGMQGAVFQMISHGFISSALFLCVGVIYDRMRSREISFYGGIVKPMPVFAAFFMLFTMANIGLPGTSGFIGEILTIIASYRISSWASLGAVTGMILSAIYALSLYRNVIFGGIENPKLEGVKDMTPREILILVPLSIAIIILGIYPSLITDMTELSSKKILLEQMKTARSEKLSDQQREQMKTARSTRSGQIIKRTQTERQEKGFNPYE